MGYSPQNTDRRWLQKIAYALFCGVGYFFGYSLVAILSFGLCRSEEFSALIHGKRRSRKFPIYKQHGGYYLESQYVTLLGYMLLTGAIWIACQ